MENVFVNRGEFRRLRQAALLPYAQNCCARILDNPVYPAVQAVVQELRGKCVAYNTALHVAANRGLDTVANKNEARKALALALDQLADAMEASNTAGDSLYLINAGFSVRQNGRRRFLGLPVAPVNVRLRPARSSGEAIVEFNPVEGARMYAFEWKDDVGQPWQNGNYSSARRVVLRVTARREIWVRVHGIATGNRPGPWSEPVMAFIP